ncbi:ion channel [Mycoplasma corogypsi]|uniref:ion channel n=1 Tax=Mycoplasma corogypsi TaxID=2106 RepID=UPI003872BCD2
MKVLKYILESKYHKATMKFLTIIFWSNLEIENSLTKWSRHVKIARGTYAFIVAFACFISFGTLFTVPDAYFRNIYETFIKWSTLMTIFIFIIDYAGHAFTYRHNYNYLKMNLFKAMLKYIFSFTGLVILACIFASMHVLKFIIADVNSSTQRVFITFESLGLARIVRLFMVLTLFKPFAAITGVFEKQRKLLTSVFFIIVVLILLFAMIIWNQELNYLRDLEKGWLASVSPNYADQPAFKPFIELKKLVPDSQDWNNKLLDIGQNDVANAVKVLNETDTSSFNALSNGYVNDFGEAFYFTTITLTTIGYGDFVPHAPISRVIVSFIALLAIAIIAIPSGVIAGSFLTEMQEQAKKVKRTKKDDKLAQELLEAQMQEAKEAAEKAQSETESETEKEKDASKKETKEDKAEKAEKSSKDDSNEDLEEKQNKSHKSHKVDKDEEKETKEKTKSHDNHDSKKDKND